jgi:hypothetical protein
MKLRGKAKAAFLRRMASGRRARRKNGRARRRTGSGAIRIVNPGGPGRFATKAYRAGYERIFGKGKARRRTSKPKRKTAKRRAHLPKHIILSAITTPPKRRKPRRKTKGSTTMARKSKRKSHRRKGAHARRRKRRVYSIRPSKRTRTIYINPRRRRGKGRRRAFRRINGSGGIVASVKAVFVPFAAGFITSMASAALDSGLASYPMAKRLAKVGGCIAIAMFGKRHPRASAAAIGALAASEGYALGTKLVGGMIAHSPAQAVQGLGDMTQTYPEMGALLNGGVGALLEGVPNVGVSASDYEAALNNMADYGDDD